MPKSARPDRNSSGTEQEDQEPRHAAEATMPSPSSSATRARTRGGPGETIEVLLRECRAGDRDAVDRLFALLYDDLRVIAHRHLRDLGGGARTLNTTALVHESYLKLAEGATPRWQERAQFFAVASKAMRHILVDYARRRSAAKRGGDLIRITLGEDTAADNQRAPDLLALDEGLSRLAAKQPRLEAIVECRFFGGMTVDQTACVLGVSTRTVERDWTRAKTYLYQMLGPDPASGAGSKP